MRAHRCLLTTAVTVAIAVVSVGLASASTAHPSAGPQRFLILTTDLNAPTYTLAATGVIQQIGQDVSLSDTQEEFVFSDGTMIMTHRAVYTNDSFDPVTCVDRFIERGTYTLSSGTGAYAGVAGRGAFTGTIQAVGCDPSGPPTALQARISAEGSIQLS
jgi:hypothetical protein